jgi:hypothetical protein
MADVLGTGETDAGVPLQLASRRTGNNNKPVAVRINAVRTMHTGSRRDLIRGSCRIIIFPSLALSLPSPSHVIETGTQFVM